MPQETCSGGHHGNKYKEGPVYKIQMFLADGVVLTSTSMEGGAAYSLLQILAALPDGSIPVVSFNMILVSNVEARKSLGEGADIWRRCAVAAEDMVDSHEGFRIQAEEAWKQAEKMAALAASIPNDK